MDVGEGVSVRLGKKRIGNKRTSHQKGSLKCLRSEDGSAGSWESREGGQIAGGEEAVPIGKP